MWFFIVLAILGLVASAAAHFATFFGVDAREVFAPVLLLHVGIFVVWIPAVVLQRRGAPADSEGNRSGGVSEVFPHAPRWMQVLTGVLFAYAIVNFITFIFLIRGGGSPTKRGDGTFTADKGRRVITEAEYRRLRAYEVRGFSGHWMMFYAAAMTTITSAWRFQRIGSAHVVPAAAEPVEAGSAAILPYQHAPRRRLPPPWLHQVLHVACIMVGWFAGPLSIWAGAKFLLPEWPGRGMICPLLAAPVLGAGLFCALLHRFVPARCPACGGRAYSPLRDSPAFTCRDCGYVHVEPRLQKK
jgi:hypothetical protein